MKIKKTNTAVNASIDAPIAVENVDPALTEVTAECTGCCKYDVAIASIKTAIESLATIAREDPIAKDSIANLGVVLLDLKGSCE